MNTDHAITIQRKPRYVIEFWSYRVGTRAQAIDSARGLLEDLKEQGLSKAKVFLNGKKILMERVKP